MQEHQQPAPRTAAVLLAVAVISVAMAAQLAFIICFLPLLVPAAVATMLARRRSLSTASAEEPKAGPWLLQPAAGSSSHSRPVVHTEGAGLCSPSGVLSPSGTCSSDVEPEAVADGSTCSSSSPSRRCSSDVAIAVDALLHAVVGGLLFEDDVVVCHVRCGNGGAAGCEGDHEQRSGKLSAPPCWWSRVQPKCRPPLHPATATAASSRPGQCGGRAGASDAWAASLGDEMAQIRKCIVYSAAAAAEAEGRQRYEFPDYDQLDALCDDDYEDDIPTMWFDS